MVESAGLALESAGANICRQRLTHIATAQMSSTTAKMPNKDSTGLARHGAPV
jgi:hypothetical protein